MQEVQQIIQEEAPEENDEMEGDEGEEEDGEYIPRSSSENSKDHIIDEDHESEQFMIVRQSKPQSQQEDIDMNDEFKESDWCGMDDKEEEKEPFPMQEPSPSPKKVASKAQSRKTSLKKQDAKEISPRKVEVSPPKASSPD